ncbi:hypothetical protein [Salibacter halophilus]|uniref:Uncharacterized protein n=1 Tax=Salibacter halophilus TaxID=1803916 RepID=A0A6N6M9W0_9FLAO|nr:hypothetical protein [Salibacter halophilus]KAB1065941.1 hypothetical protein F3059_00275 [Salibacter halophilus]
MDDKTEIITFHANDIRVGVLTSRLDSLDIQYDLRETTTFMEPAYQLKVSKENISTVNTILNEITDWNSSNENDSSSIFGQIRKVGVYFTWFAIISAIGLLIYMTWLILNGELPRIAWTGVVFMTIAIGFIAYLELRKKKKTTANNG